jgi:hypothetical protein
MPSNLFSFARSPRSAAPRRDRGQTGGFNSPASQPAEFEFIGSGALTVRLSPHFSQGGRLVGTALDARHRVAAGFSTLVDRQWAMLFQTQPIG